jgi:hypothetical protein
MAGLILQNVFAATADKTTGVARDATNNKAYMYIGILVSVIVRLWRRFRFRQGLCS